MNGSNKLTRIVSRLCATAAMIAVLTMTPMTANAAFNLPTWLGGKPAAPPVQVIPRPPVMPHPVMAGKPGKPGKLVKAMKSVKSVTATKPGERKLAANKAKTREASVARVRVSRRILAERRIREARLREADRLRAIAQYKRDFLKALQLPNSKLTDGRSERWNLKVGLDPDAKGVFQSSDTPIQDNVEDLATMPRQAGTDNLNRRFEPYETTPWTIEGTIVAFGVAPDGDYVLVVKGTKPGNLSPAVLTAYQNLPGTHFADTIIAAIPDPAKISSDSAWKSDIQAVRTQFDHAFTGVRHPGPIMRRLYYPVNVRLTGVGLFDIDHKQDGRAPNILTLHPVLKMELTDEAPAASSTH